MAKRHRPEDATTPAGLAVLRVAIAGERYAVISFDQAASAPAELSRLSAAERAVIELALEGLDNQGIANARRTSARTVAKQLASAYRKLGVSSRRELLAWHLRRT